MIAPRNVPVTLLVASVALVGCGAKTDPQAGSPARSRSKKRVTEELRRRVVHSR